MHPLQTSILRRLSFCFVIGISLIQGACASQTEASEQPLESSFELLQVPEVWGDPSSRQIEVAYLHLDGQGSEMPTFVFLGGPGESALDYGTMEELRGAFGALLASGDVIIVEQRGGKASPSNLDCGSVVLPLDQPATRAGFDAAYADALASCAAISDADLTGYTADAIAQDADAIRMALGLDQINLSGGSFGAAQAFAYIQRYPEHVNRAVMTQFLPPQTSLAMPSTIDGYLHELGDRVGPSLGLEEGGGDMLLGMIRDVLESAEQEPVVITVGDTQVTAGRTDLEVVTALALRRTREARLLPMLYSQMQQGDFEFVGWAMLQFYRSGLPVNAGALALDCADLNHQELRDQFEADVETSLAGAGSNIPFPDVCDHLDHGWNVTAALPASTLNGVPTLIIQGDLDARARDEVLAEWLDQQPNARMLTIQNVTHDLGGSVSDTIGDEIDAITAEFLSSGQWPETSTIDVP